MTTSLEPVRAGVIAGNVKSVQQNVQAALDSGQDAKTILTDGLISAMEEVGARYEAGEFFVPEMLLAARAMKAGLQLLKPHLIDAHVEPIGKVAVGTVAGDLHDIGKNLVAMMFEGAGFEVLDLGVDVPPEKYVEAVRGGASLVAMSSLLTTTLPNMRTVIDALKDSGVRDRAKVIVGGAPVTQDYADTIGADGYAPDASQAVSRAKELLGA